MPNKFKFYFLLLLASLSIISCKKDDDSSTVPLRDYAEQYPKDLDSIEKYLKTHYMVVNNVDGQIDVDIKDLPTDGSQVSIWDNTQYPLKNRILKSQNRLTNYVDGRIKDDVDYKLYYIILNEGGGEHPTVVDSVFTTYRGWTLDDNEEFDRSVAPFWSTYPVLNTGEVSLLTGYREFVPELRTAESSVPNPDGTIKFINSGVGVVFMPSGLAYYNAYSTGIPAYSPLAFLVRLNGLQRRDHDRDKVWAMYEDLNGNGDFYDDDTDGDNIPNFLDRDDDGDGFLTEYEIRTDQTNEDSPHYTFDNIPGCGSGTLKIFLDPSCHTHS